MIKTSFVQGTRYSSFASSSDQALLGNLKYLLNQDRLYGITEWFLIALCNLYDCVRLEGCNIATEQMRRDVLTKFQVLWYTSQQFHMHKCKH